MQIHIELPDDRYCDGCKLKQYDEPCDAFLCAMGYWDNDTAETAIDSVTEEPVEFWESDGTIVFMRPQVCKDNHDTPPEVTLTQASTVKIRFGVMPKDDLTTIQNALCRFLEGEELTGLGLTLLRG